MNRAWIFTLVALTCSSARASDLSPSGQIEYAPDALAAIGFESTNDLLAAGLSYVDWTQTAPALDTTPLTAQQIDALLTTRGTGAPAALDGHRALRLDSSHAAIALRDSTVFDAQTGNRISVSMWGRSFGAEPVLELVYAHNTTNVGPGRMRVIAIRTGRETSDGWVEYATGPIDGQEWSTPLRAIVLTPRFATSQGALTLVDDAFEPGQTAPTLENPNAYAVVDAVEIVPADGPVQSPAVCTQQTVDSACGAQGSCMFGHCIDSTLVWGPVPSPASQRSDLVARWSFLMQSLIGDRHGASNATTAFAGAAQLVAATTPRGFWQGLHQAVVGVGDSHTYLGHAASSQSALFPLPGRDSGALDACFGVAQNDLGAGEQVYAIFAVGHSPTPSVSLQVGDILTSVDGLTTADWLALVTPRFTVTPPNDPSAAPATTALALPQLLERYGSTVTFSRCTPSGGCATLPPIDLADPVYQSLVATGTFRGNSLACTLRFQSAVASPPPDDAAVDQVVTQTVGNLTSVQFDGFEAAYDATLSNPSAAWEDPFTTALSAGTPVLIDARLGFGGAYALGEWLYQQIRASSDPFGMVGLPRGAYDDADPAWLFAQPWSTCSDTDYVCQWGGGQTSFASIPSPVGATTKVAWVNSEDVSMNDITPRLLQGRPNFRIFAPHVSHGAYGEISRLPALAQGWGEGSMQVLDSRFGDTPADAIAAPWASGRGVVPDQVVVQKISDLLAGQDTLLLAAKAWLNP